MRRLFGAGALIAALVGGVVGCARAETEQFGVPEGVDLQAASQIRDQGNGLWLLEGEAAVTQILHSVDDAQNVQMVATVEETISTEGGVSVAGRTIQIETVRAGATDHIKLRVGEQSGELVIKGSQVVARGNAAFAKALEFDGASDTFRCVPVNTSALVSYRRLADPAEFLRTALSGVEAGVLRPAESHAPEQTLSLGAASTPIGTMTVAARGRPLPSVLELTDKTGLIRAEYHWDRAPRVTFSDDIKCGSFD